jgi:hypothetical protein
MRWLILRLVFILFIAGSILQPFSIGAIENIKTQKIAKQTEQAESQSPTLFALQTAHAQNDGDLSAITDESKQISFWDIMDMDFTTFFATIVYFWIGWPFQLLAQLSALFLDSMIAISIDSNTYRNFDFINDGWRVVRDVSNIGFIFALLIVAFGVVLRIEKINTKKLLVNIIVVAVLINFSLFFMKVVVDVSNILSKVFYNNVTVVQGPGAPDPYAGSFFGGGEPKQITSAIMSKLEPQKLLSESFNDKQMDGQEVTGIKKVVVSLFIILLLIVIHAILFYVFTVSALMFLARIISIALAMILAPFAMVTLLFPGGTRLTQLGFSDWLSSFLKACFMAPIFVFLLFVVLQFLNSSFITVSPTGGFWISLIEIIIPFSVLIGLLFGAMKITQKFSGRAGEAIGGAVTGAAKLAMTGAVAAATGGVGLAASGAAGAAGRTLAKTGVAKNWATSGNLLKRNIGGFTRNVADRAQRVSGDIRQTGIGQQAMKKAGMEGGMSNMFGGYLKGGAIGRQERRDKAADERMERDKVQAGEPAMQQLDIAKQELSDAQDAAEPVRDDKKVFEETYKKDLKQLDENIQEKRETLTSISTELKKNPGDAALTAAQATAQSDLDAAKDAKDNFEASNTIQVVREDPITGEAKLENKSLEDIKAELHSKERDVRDKNNNVQMAQRNIDAINKQSRENQASSAKQATWLREGFSTLARNIAIAGVVGTAAAATGGASLVATGAIAAGTATAGTALELAARRKSINEEAARVSEEIKAGIIGRRSKKSADDKQKRGRKK